MDRLFVAQSLEIGRESIRLETLRIVGVEFGEGCRVGPLARRSEALFSCNVADPVHASIRSACCAASSWDAVVTIPEQGFGGLNGGAAEN